MRRRRGVSPTRSSSSRRLRPVIAARQGGETFGTSAPTETGDSHMSIAGTLASLPVTLANTGGDGDFASFDVPVAAWVVLIAGISTMLIVDLLLVHRTAHVITIKEAAIESAVWISIGLLFGVALLVWQGG